MTSKAGRLSHSGEPTFRELFTPKLVTVFREGYGVGDFRADVLAGLTVAVVALPLSMAIAIASGATPAQGLYTAIIGGFLVSLLGGSRFQIGGPAGAFIVLVAATVVQHGMAGMILATFIAGFILMAVGFLRLGTYIKFIPYPVTVGFTAGIAAIIFASQVKELLGLTLPGAEPAAIIPKIAMLGQSIGTISPAAVAVSAVTILLIVGIKRMMPSLPNLLIAVAAAAAGVFLLGLPVETIGSRFGGIPRALPFPALPDLSPSLIAAVLPNALGFALLGAIESLLSAVVADGMTGRRHRSNCELVAQGVANIGSALFGGICVTGTIARTATNVRSGARGPISGMLHSLFLLLFMLLAAPLAALIPLASLAGVLAVVAWNMAEKQQFWVLLRSSWGDALVVMATFLLTVFRDLTEGIVVGFALGAVLFINRMAKSTGIEEIASPDIADDANGSRGSYDVELATDPDIVVYRIRGAFFFGAASTVGTVLDRISPTHKTFIVDFDHVPFIDSTAANTIAGVARRAERHHVQLYITGASPAVRRELLTHGVKSHAEFRTSIAEAAQEAREKRRVIGRTV